MSGRWIRPISHWLRYCNLRCWPYFTSSNIKVCFVAVFNRVQTSRPHGVFNAVPDGAQKHIQPVNILPAMKQRGCSSPYLLYRLKYIKLHTCANHKHMWWKVQSHCGVHQPLTVGWLPTPTDLLGNKHIRPLTVLSLKNTLWNKFSLGNYCPELWTHCPLHHFHCHSKPRMLSNIHSPHTTLIHPVLMWSPLPNEAELSQGNARHPTERCSLQLQYTLM